MKQGSFFAILLLFVFSGCNSSVKSTPKKLNKTAVNQHRVPGADAFELVNDSLASGSLIRHRKWAENAPIGDFLSRLWYLYGKPPVVMFEGFQYTIRHKKTGLVFMVYCGASGPAYGGDQAIQARLIPVIDDFDRMLDSAKHADCELRFETDFGVSYSGSKNGIPFDR